jgi:hypothetical protein
MTAASSKPGKVSQKISEAFWQMFLHSSSPFMVPEEILRLRGDGSSMSSQVLIERFGGMSAEVALNKSRKLNSSFGAWFESVLTEFLLLKATMSIGFSPQGEETL